MSAAQAIALHAMKAIMGPFGRLMKSVTLSSAIWKTGLKSQLLTARRPLASLLEILRRSGFLGQQTLEFNIHRVLLIAACTASAISRQIRIF
jgi:hypothetical protein